MKNWCCKPSTGVKVVGNKNPHLNNYRTRVNSDWLHATSRNAEILVWMYIISHNSYYSICMNFVYQMSPTLIPEYHTSIAQAVFKQQSLNISSFDFSGKDNITVLKSTSCKTGRLFVNIFIFQLFPAFLFFTFQ